MRNNLRGRLLLIAAVAAFGGVSVASCDKMAGNDGTEYLEDDYVPVTEFIDDWSGDYVVAHAVDAKSVAPFAGLDGSDGKAGKALKIHAGGILWGSSADEVKTVLKKADDWSYTMHIAGVGYIGYDGESGFVRSYTENTGDAYLWDVLLSESGSGYVRLSPKTADEMVSLAWDEADASFTVCCTGTPALLFRRVEATGIENNPTPPDGGGDNPQPSPTPTNAKYGWFELPAVNYEVVGSDLRGKDNNTLYYAHHFCAGGEKDAKGRTARNFSVCYSSEYRCPMWVAAPRHQMYKGSGRHENYKDDPNISCVQNGKWTGYTRGHMVGSSDRNHSVATNHQVFYHSNIAPQLSSGFNTGGGAWNMLEDHIDGLECSDTLYAVVGCYFDRFTDKYNSTIAPRTASGGQIPTMFYYVLLRTKKGNTGKSVTQCSSSELQCVAFVLSHKGNQKHEPQANDMMSVSDLEKLTGFSYFPNVPNAPKTTYTPSDWL